jgi:hypothetical protein
MIKTMGRIARVSVRLTKDDAKKLAYLSRTEGKSNSEVIQAAIRHYYDTQRLGRSMKRCNLFETGFVGCAQGDANLSTTYKGQLTDSLLRKHGYR